MILLNKLLCLLIIYGNLVSIDAIPNNPSNYKIGGVFSLRTSQFHFNETIKVNIKIFIFIFLNIKFFIPMFTHKYFISYLYIYILNVDFISSK